MPFYPPQIDARFNSARNEGTVEAGTRGLSASFLCGSFVEVSVDVNVDTGSVDSARYRTNGCGFMIAAADALCDWLTGKSLAALHGLNDEDLTAAIAEELGPYPPDRNHCSTVAFDALRDAMAGHRRRIVEEFQGEKALICTCFGVSEETVVAAIEENGFTNVDQLAEGYRAGSGCGSCRFLIQELIDMRTGGYD